MALTPLQRDALTRANDALRLQLRDKITKYALTLWGPRGALTDAEAAAFVERLVPVVQAGQLQVAAITQAYVEQMIGAPLAAETIDPATLRGGVTPEDVYQRPTVTLRDKLAKGKTFDAALAAASNRLANLIATDMQLAMTHQSRASLKNAPKSWGYRRTLTGRENCAICMIASTQRYHRGDLNPIHPGCDCGVEPLPAGMEFDQVIDPERLEATHDWVAQVAGKSDASARNLPGGTNKPKDYMDLIAVHEHGEYGPTLTWRRHDFTGPADI